MSDEFTRKQRKEKLQGKKKPKGPAPPWSKDIPPEYEGDKGLRKRPRKRNWSVDDFLDDEEGYDED